MGGYLHEEITEIKKDKKGWEKRKVEGRLFFFLIYFGRRLMGENYFVSS